MLAPSNLPLDRILREQLGLGGRGEAEIGCKFEAFDEQIVVFSNRDLPRTRREGNRQGVTHLYGRDETLEIERNSIRVGELR